MDCRTAETRTRNTYRRSMQPELAVPAEEFFKEAAKREIYVTVNKKFLVGSSDWDAVERKKKINQWED